MLRTSSIFRWLALVVVAAALLAGCQSALAPSDTPAAGTGAGPTAVHATAVPSVLDGFATIRVDQLPPEARDTLALIAQGGPFPYRQDGVVFQNREGYLPSRPNGYYHEYTVKTPGSSDRGARRIITGEGGERYYTDDHYVTFKRIVQ